MEDNTVAVDYAVSPAKIEYSTSFNVAVPFIDRRLSEGRGQRIAIRTIGGNVTYDQLAERVNRCGNLLISQ